MERTLSILGFILLYVAELQPFWFPAGYTIDKMTIEALPKRRVSYGLTEGLWYDHASGMPIANVTDNKMW